MLPTIDEGIRLALVEEHVGLDGARQERADSLDHRAALVHVDESGFLGVRNLTQGGGVPLLILPMSVPNFGRIRRLVPLPSRKAILQSLAAGDQSLNPLPTTL